MKNEKPAMNQSVDILVQLSWLAPIVGALIGLWRSIALVRQQQQRSVEYIAAIAQQPHEAAAAPPPPATAPQEPQ